MKSAPAFPKAVKITCPHCAHKFFKVKHGTISGYAKELEAVMSKHTPGPWEIQTYNDHEGFSVWAKGYGCVAERWFKEPLDRPGDEALMSNASLIAASPELLAAAKRSQEILAAVLSCKAVDRDWLIEVLGAPIFTTAIGKAEGRSE